ncbi:unnamed protein product (macronuclear) [Paramecium tetraurelia]|uniref:CAAX prenyl protease 2/Lysostaphin resistance protein A-like domain-containing protein n=1 Tax=Paramecium tetraurelia TaxID=5888 RepID=A0CY54_PARTE|nr:uncharacterized protein GSPATT00011353001 [Paramecium tetraurelia]CAK75721.1 unnamed protein product [Paramecium tetraurelia]|eukprot:XP_001443118.1 hypothetical protein (macronuclear) [Paramecium tetraurelia strain d4-2]
MDSKVYDEEQNDETVQLSDQKPKLTFVKLLLLELLMISPVIWVLLFLWVLKMPLGCQLAFQIITLLAIPLISLQIQKKHFSKLIKTDLYISEIGYGLLFLIGSFLATVIFGYVVFQYYDILDYEAIKTLKGNQLSLILALILLSITNPFLEEFFWRVYLPDQYTTHEEIKYNEQLKWYLALHYALYHFFVIYFLTKLMIISLIGFIMIAIGGRIFFITRDKFGLLTTSLFHMGVDLGVVAMAIYKIPLNGE